MQILIGLVLGAGIEYVIACLMMVGGQADE